MNEKERERKRQEGMTELPKGKNGKREKGQRVKEVRGRGGVGIMTLCGGPLIDDWWRLNHCEWSLFTDRKNGGGGGDCRKLKR